jgi:hypothetical protein
MVATVKVYLLTGQVFSYTIPNPEKGREHAYKIWTEGYRHNDGKEFVWYGPHWIDKIKITPAPKTAYPDQETGT